MPKAKVSSNKNRKLVAIRPEAVNWLNELSALEDRKSVDYLTRLVRKAAKKAGIVAKGHRS